MCLLVKNKRLSIVFLVETKLDTGYLDMVRRKLGFNGCLRFNLVGRKGGVALLWRMKEQCEFFNFFQHHISVWVEDIEAKSKWLLTSFYREAETSKRRHTWQLLSYLNRYTSPLG